MRPPCHRTKNRAFSNPTKAHRNSINAAIKMCEHCPLLKQCATEAITAGTSLNELNRSPANDVIQAGVICHGDLDTAYRLAQIAEVEVPHYLMKRQHRENMGAHRPGTCRNCHRPMIKWNRYEKQPEGYQKHHGRGFCTDCRAAYEADKKANPRPPSGLRKQVDRKRHSAPPRKTGTPTIQLTLFEISA